MLTSRFCYHAFFRNVFKSGIFQFLKICEELFLFLRNLRWSRLGQFFDSEWQQMVSKDSPKQWSFLKTASETFVRLCERSSSLSDSSQPNFEKINQEQTLYSMSVTASDPSITTSTTSVFIKQSGRREIPRSNKHHQTSRLSLTSPLWNTDHDIISVIPFFFRHLGSKNSFLLEISSAPRHQDLSRVLPESRKTLIPALEHHVSRYDQFCGTDSGCTSGQTKTSPSSHT